MARLLRIIVVTSASFALLTAPVGAFANTRASSGTPVAIPASSANAVAFPFSSWLVPDETDPSALWQWLLGGTVTFSLLSVVISNEPDAAPRNRSNGAN